MRHIGNTLFILAAASTTAAIWSPIGTWWQWLASAILLFLAGAYAHGTHHAAQAPHTEATPTKARPHNNYGTPA